MIVIDRNMFEIPQKEIQECRVELTIFDGAVIFDREKNGVC